MKLDSEYSNGTHGLVGDICKDRQFQQSVIRVIIEATVLNYWNIDKGGTNSAESRRSKQFHGR